MSSVDVVWGAVVAILIITTVLSGGAVVYLVRVTRRLHLRVIELEHEDTEAWNESAFMPPPDEAQQAYGELLAVLTRLDNRGLLPSCEESMGGPDGSCVICTALQGYLSNHGRES